jgi:predicted ATPase
MVLATDQGFPRFVNLGTALRGWLSVKHGDVEEGIGLLRRALASLTFNPERQESVALLVEGYGKLGRADEGFRVLDGEFVAANKTGVRNYEPELHRVKGELLLLTQAAASKWEAEACFQNALNIARRRSAKSLELRAAMSLSRLWQRQGKKVEARNLLAEIYGWFTEGFDTADLKQAKLILEELA